MLTLRTALLAAPLIALAWTTAPAMAAPSETLSFTVLRNGKPVGTHTVRFIPRTDGMGVAVDTDVVVKMAMIPVYRFEHHGEETWRHDQLVALDSTTNDDGTHHKLKVAANSAALDVDSDGKVARLPAAILPASLWNVKTTTQGKLMNTLDGHAMAVTVSDLGEDAVTVHGQSRPAHHYSLAGELAREVWYDGDGTLVKVRFRAKDDSDIEYVLN